MIVEDSIVSAEPLIVYYSSVRAHTEALCAPLQVEDYIPQPVDFVSPPKWHLAHTTWFFEEFLLKTHLHGYKIFHADFSYLFNSYYNAVGKRVLRTDRGNLTRPGVKEIYKYRAYVDEHVKILLGSNQSAELEELLVLGCNHEQQHQELLITDFKFILGHNPIWPVYKEGFSLVKQYNESAGNLTVNEGVYEIGFQGNSFHYDNELGRHKVYLHDFEISKALVTNGEFLDFIKDGGYQRSELWLDEGWSWIQNNQSVAPLYWHHIEGDWFYYTLDGLQPIDPKTILCHVNYYEAWAFAEWKGMRLPTEFEWEVASNQFKWGHRWEWTSSAYLPYPGFAKAEGAIGEYNGKFMVNQMVLRGGSTATAPGHSRNSYRNFFQTHLGWQCTGIRLAKHTF